MSKLQLRLVGAGAAMTVLLALAGCKHKPVVPPPPAPVAAPAPSVTINADPTAIQRGQSSTLTWTSGNATRVELNGAAVNLNGSQQVTPTESTDYQIVATNADGKQATASVRVTVSEPAPVAAPTPKAEDIDQLFQENVKDAFFDYDKSSIRADAQQALNQDAAFLKAHPDLSVVVEGHCDDRGSAEYNMGLGDRRANAVRDYLIQQGVEGSKIRTLSYGKEKPFCTEETEDCYQQNRRGHIVRAQ